MRRQTQSFPQSNRVPLQLEMNNNKKVYRLTQTSLLPIVIITLFLVSTIGLVLFITISSSINIINVMNGILVTNQTKPNSKGCLNYYCNQVAYYYIHEYYYYQQCNQLNCQIPLCLSSQFNWTTNTNINLYYTCYNIFQANSNNYPQILLIVLVISILSTSLLIITLIISCIVGWRFSRTYNFSYKQNVFLMLAGIIPAGKYYVLRQRTNWISVNISFKSIIFADILVCIALGISLTVNSYIGGIGLFKSFEAIVTAMQAVTFFCYIAMLSRNYTQLLEFQSYLQSGQIM